MSRSEELSVLIAPGQGSQRPGMYSLVKELPEIADTYDLADEISMELFGPSRVEGKSVSQWAKDASHEEMANNTVITQPLIVATSIGLIKYLKQRESFTTAYGHSLGELSALFASGCLSEADAIKLAMLRGLYSREASQQRAGGMAALMNIPHEIKERLQSGEEDEEVVISTDNNPDQFTISGPKDKIDHFVTSIRDQYQKVKGLSKEEKRQLPNAVRMKIEGGFHSWMMKPAQKNYREALDKTTISVPTDMNFFSNHSHNYEGSPDIIRQHLEDQLVHPVKFWEDIGRLVMDGHVRIVESGIGSILITGLRDQQKKGRLPQHVELIAAEEDILRVVA